MKNHAVSLLSIIIDEKLSWQLGTRDERICFIFLTFVRFQRRLRRIDRFGVGKASSAAPPLMGDKVVPTTPWLEDQDIRSVRITSGTPRPLGIKPGTNANQAGFMKHKYYSESPRSPWGGEKSLRKDWQKTKNFVIKQGGVQIST